ncbi:MAG: TRAP transporter small permease [Candidatus Krumholzibacteria bacterium]|nr:TRAP transporter small permease [Candidatus Krumholzibacteria bacterium]
MAHSPTTYVLIALAIAAMAVARARLDGSRRARRVYDAFGALEVSAVVALLAALVGIGFLQIVLRNVAHRGLLWADPLMRHAVLWIGALGASLATSRLRHINIDVFTRLLPAALRPARRALVYGATAVAAFMLGVAALRLVASERAYGEIAFLGIATWQLQAVLPFAFFLVAYRSIVNLIRGREPDPVREGLEP